MGVIREVVRPFAVACAAMCVAIHATIGQTPVPTRYIADRFFAVPVTTQGDTLLLLVDTGGGGAWVIKPVLERLGITPRFVGVQGDSVYMGGKFPTFAVGAEIPIPLGAPDTSITGFGNDATKEAMGGAVGILGHTWLAGRVWVFDYPRRHLSFYDVPPIPNPFGPHTIPMTLKEPLVRNDPRIEVRIDGDTIGVLLDTGGTSELSPDAVKATGGGPSMRASAFATARLWDKWHRDHPSWRVVRRGELTTNADLIEVPTVNIGGYDVGPVWFAKRSDRAYDGIMMMMMDQPILAAIGGNALKTFRITLDYPNQRATFERRDRAVRVADK